ncbi:hypothetical protein ROA7450_02898 [Roseovarius albus]|uniref:Alpha/beta hydrolase family protein n=1 Tax=Roseovarius albus TaxID=1247867 RepID=A0A1X6ZN17_9RHOB|nr:pimeloyl-ACP methyl esterase BioG family protein [Roseovarius albus]SLN56072.1 hypothetical protein ROA7450_02898 [Roseovarius albus]
MRKQWLSHAGGVDLLLVFGGWGLGPAPFKGLSGAGDVLFVDDYTTLDNGLLETSDYDETTLLAYSFGVVSAAHWLAQTGFRPNRKVAVNGTLYPANENKGIATETVNATIDGLSPDSFSNFCRRAGFRDTPPQIDITTAQEELRAIMNRGSAPETTFDRIWISQRDRIIPAQAQTAAWAAQEKTIKYNPGSHCPFTNGQSWQEWLS